MYAGIHFYNFWMVEFAVPLHFLKVFQIWIISFKTLIFCIKTGFVLEIRNIICCNRKGPCWYYIFWKINKHIFNKINMDSIQKPGAVIA